MCCRWGLLAVFSMCALVAAAQSDLTVTVADISSAKGKVMVATDKGQYNMVDVQGVDAVLVLKADTKAVDVKLVDVRRNREQKELVDGERR